MKKSSKSSKSAKKAPSARAIGTLPVRSAVNGGAEQKRKLGFSLNEQSSKLT